MDAGSDLYIPVVKKYSYKKCVILYFHSGKTSSAGIFMLDIEVMEDEINIVWMFAKYTDPKNKWKKIDWTDVVPKLSILLFWI